MLHPAARLVWIAAAMAAAAIGVAIVAAYQAQWLTLAAAAALVAALDLLAGLRLPAPAVARRLPATLALGVRIDVALRVANLSGRRLRCELHDHHPASFEAEGLPRRLELGAARVDRGRLPGAPGGARRGALRRDGVAALLAARVVANHEIRRKARQSVRVYPNFRALAKYTLLATDNRLSQIGVLQVRRRGEGMEFHQLREYRQGDSQRAIDWKATSRTARLISREYEDEKDQRVLLVIDCGRRMASKDDSADDSLSHFDHVLNAALLLAHVAAAPGRRGGHDDDGRRQPLLRAAQVGGGGERHPQPGLRHRADPGGARLPPGGARRDAARAAARRWSSCSPTCATRTTRPCCRRCRLLRTRHLVVLASLREAILGRALSARVDSFDRAVTHAAAADYLAGRERAFRRLGRGRGDLPGRRAPERLAISLVNRYLELKRAGRL